MQPICLHWAPDLRRPHITQLRKDCRPAAAAAISVCIGTHGGRKIIGKNVFSSSDGISWHPDCKSLGVSRDPQTPCLSRLKIAGPKSYFCIYPPPTPPLFQLCVPLASKYVCNMLMIGGGGREERIMSRAFCGCCMEPFGSTQVRDSVWEG